MQDIKNNNTMSHFNNSYYLMRHGESEANTAGLIIANPSTGCIGFGLSKQGRQQVKNSVTVSRNTKFSQVICSDFLRTVQTAELTTHILGLPAPQVNKLLRERNFGDFEGKSDSYYQQVWQGDEMNEEYATNNVESPVAVRQRGIKLLKELEKQYKNQCILLISHGDMLQILRTAFTNLNPGKHRQLAHHKTAEIKILVNKGDALPDCWL